MSSPTCEEAPGYLRKKVLVFGCGNPLWGDDGVGPRLAQELKKVSLPPEVGVWDVGTSLRGILFDLLLSEKKPEHVFILDAIPMGLPPGTVKEIPLDALPEIKIDDFSLHQAPTSNLLKELAKKTSIRIHILGIQPAYLPETVSPGLSPTLEQHLPEVVEKIHAYLQEVLREARP